ncbi:3-succinoylsemialdehyde-pyridine dehydrogenase [Pseudomonas fluorescens]|uniref:3-succinoylsemialdehyde-pyridine dehydrogenase n=1 Tax=Pseudomonas fluorescens TaxID=294 RepID=A0A8H2RIM2_PSEFL|nr:aldehyde dehydrogenase family protein [Pseudomonas fluorescens]VVP16953.1 3-succinoylsemialdehyde-pyridine dehydrogenase [Pseudomonas fluorescens]
MTAYQHHLIDGIWTAAQSAEHTKIYDSASEAELGQVAHGTTAEIYLAVRAAKRALASWSTLPVSTRADYVRSIANQLEEQVEQLAQGVVAEVGMPIKLSQRIQVQAPILAWRATADLAVESLADTSLGHSIINHVPVGIVGAITPWNYPLHQITAKVAAALVAGCTVVLKPSELAPCTARALGEAALAAGLPEGVLNIVMGDATTGQALVDHPDVALLSFTGSTAVGRRIAASAGQALKRVSLELGGKSACIATADAAAESVVRQVIGSCFLNSGQSCNSLTRLLVPIELYDTYRALLANAVTRLTLGDPLDPATRMGPLVSAAHRDRVHAMIVEGESQGLDLIAGGSQAQVPATGYFIAPTIFGRVPPQSTLAQQEVFGPVLSVMTYENEQQALEIANGTAYGLAAAVWAGHIDHALKLARQLRAGQVDVNGAPYNPAAPFGGFGDSGLGREGGTYGIEEFVEIRAIQMPVSSGREKS